MPWLKKLINSATLKIISDVFESCNNWLLSLSLVLIPNEFGSFITDDETNCGPIGQNVSNP